MADDVKTFPGSARQRGYEYVLVPGTTDTYAEVSGTVLNGAEQVPVPSQPGKFLKGQAASQAGLGSSVPSSAFPTAMAPANLTLPTISGTAQVGQTLTRVNGTWSGTAPITYAHQWLAGGLVISGATAATYVPTTADIGKTITSRTTATNAAGSVSAMTAATSAVIAAAAALSISGANGTANVGDTASFTPTISGGTAPYSVAATGLPPGRSINNAATGLTTGAYTTVGSYNATYNATYTVTDSVGATASFTRTIVVSAGVFSPLISTEWRQPILAGYDSGGVAGPDLVASSTQKTLPLATVATSPTVAITTSGASVAAGSNVLTVSATAHGLSVGDIVRATGTTTAPAGVGNGWMPVASVPDANTFTLVTQSGTTFTAASAAVGGTYIKTTGTVRDFSVQLDTVPAEGSFLYFDIADSNAWKVTWHESADTSTGAASSGAWTSNSFTPFGTPVGPGDTGPQSYALRRGQVIKIGTGGWKRVRITNYDNSNSLSFLMGVFKQASSTIKPDLGFAIGSSTVVGDLPIRQMRQRLQAIRPSRDPIIVNGGYFGANTATIQAFMVAPWISIGLKPGYVLFQKGANDEGQGRPYAADIDQAKVARGMQTTLDAVRNAWGNDLPVFASNASHVNFATPNPVNDLANTENGVEPYQFNQVEPKIRDAFPAYNWSSTYGRPINDELLATAMYFPGSLTPDGTHPFGHFYYTLQETSDRADQYLFSGTAAKPLVHTTIEAAEIAGLPSWHKARLQTIYGLLGGSLAPLVTRLNAVSTTYTEAPGTKPTDLTTKPAWWFDPAKFDLAAVTSGLVTGITDRSPNAYVLSPPSAARQPSYIPARRNGRGVLGATNASAVGGTGAPPGLIGALNAAAQPFMLFFLVKSNGSGGAGQFFGIGQATANKLMVGPTTTDALGLAASGPVRVFAATSAQPAGATLIQESLSTGGLTTHKWLVYSVLYDGAALTLRRNGVQIGAFAWAKPEWAADSFMWLSNGPDTGRFAGEMGDFIGRLDYNLADAQTIEAYLMAK